MLLPAFVNVKYGYVDENGRMAIDPIFDEGNSFQDDRALVRVEQRFGYISPDGIMAIDPIFEDAGSFTEGCAEATYEGGRYLIDTEGDILSQLAYGNYYSISEGLLCVNLGGRNVEIEEHGFKQLLTEGGRWGYVDRYGSFVRSPKYLHAMPSLTGWPMSSSKSQAVSTKAATSTMPGPWCSRPRTIAATSSVRDSQRSKTMGNGVTSTGMAFW